jgi:hypothetical protein
MENKHADGIGRSLLDRNGGLQKYRGGSRLNGVAYYVPDLRHGASGEARGAEWQVRQGGVRPQERAPNYLIAIVLLCIGVGAW